MIRTILCVLGWALFAILALAPLRMILDGGLAAGVAYGPFVTCLGFSGAFLVLAFPPPKRRDRRDDYPLAPGSPGSDRARNGRLIR